MQQAFVVMQVFKIIVRYSEACYLIRSPMGMILGPCIRKVTLYVNYTFVTGFAKTDLLGTNTEIHFLSVDESHTHALSKNTKHLRLGGQVCFYRQTLSNHESAFHGLCGPEGH